MDPQTAHVQHIQGQNQFQTEVLDSKIPVLLDFYAEWCGPCKMAAPIMDKLSGVYQDKAKVIKIDVDDPENRTIAMAHQVMSIPTVVMYKDGKVVNQKIGFIGEPGYKQMIESALSN
jgi:thioredoxin 1